MGTLYKQVSPFEAKKLGAALVAKNVARHVETLFAGKGRGWRPLVYCWRGGKRSGAMAHILREIGWDAADAAPAATAATAAGSSAQLEQLPAAASSCGVIHGPTGSGKSRLLARAAPRRRPGARPGGPRRAPRLGARRPAGPAAALAEVVREPAPARAFGARARAAGVRRRRVEEDRPAPGPGSADRRACAPRPASCSTRRARRASACSSTNTAISSKTAPRSKRSSTASSRLHGRERIARWKALAAQGAWREFVAVLLEEHYDPAYRRSSQRNFTHLEAATRLAIRSSEDAAFDAAARALVEDPVAA